MTNKSLEEKLGLLKQLIFVANADGKISESEYQLLLGMAGQMGLSKEDFDRVFDPELKIIIPKSDGDRIIQFHRMILLMNVDMDAAPAEIETIRKMATMLGLSPQAVEIVFEEMKTYPNNLIPPTRMIEIFRKFMN
jgi:uncharacterized tellurite resistance protein B-like protein